MKNNLNLHKYRIKYIYIYTISYYNYINLYLIKYFYYLLIYIYKKKKTIIKLYSS